MTPIAPHITAFLRERLPVQQGASVHTCDTYAYAFQLLFQYASARLKTSPSKLNLEKIDAKLVMDFLVHLEQERGNSVKTRNLRLAAIKSFMRFVQFRVPACVDQARCVLAIPLKKTVSRVVPHLSLAEVTAILDSPELDTRLGVRDRAMLHVCFAAGLRVSELVGLCMSDVRLQPAPTIQVHGKGRRERVLPLWKQAARDLRAWLAIRGEAPTPELFLNACDAPMTRSGFAYVLRKHASSAAKQCPSLKKRRVSPHVLRHTCAMTILQATGDLRRVSLWLGHADMQTTQTYLHADPGEKLQAIEAITPLALRKGRFRAPDRLIASLHARDGNTRRRGAGAVRPPIMRSQRART